jgi:glucans biosynthesis protein C
MKPQRFHGLDTLRGFALLLGVVLHSSMAFLPGLQIWVVADSSRSPALSVLFYAIHTFRMVLFFVLAGMFTKISLERLGFRNFAFDRLKRILLPLVLMWLPILAAITAILVWNATIAAGGVSPASQSTPPLSLENFPLAHLWFLYVLLILYAVMLPLRLVVQKLGLARVLDSLTQVACGWGGVLLLALPMTAALYLQPSWLAWFGIPTPDMSLLPNLTALVSYGAAFAFGWLLLRQASWQEHLIRRWGLHLAMALVCTVSSLWLLGLAPVLMPVSESMSKFLYAGLYALSAWGWVLGLLGVALRFFAQPSAAWRYVADASYWVYLVHLPLVMVGQTLLARVELSWVLKFPLIVLGVLGLAFSSYHLLVRFSVIGVVLNGSRNRIRHSTHLKSM